MTNILETALEKTQGDRQADYGDPAVNHKRIALLWNAYLKAACPGTCPGLSAVDVVLMIDLLKTARLIETCDHEDTWLDKAGYAWVGYECAKADDQ